MAVGGIEAMKICSPRQVRVEAGAFDECTHFGQNGGEIIGHRSTEYLDFATCCRGKAEQQPDSRGLTGAVGAEETEDGAGWHPQIHAIHGELRPEALGQTLGSNREVTCQGSHFAAAAA